MPNCEKNINFMGNTANFPLDKISEVCYNCHRSESESILLSETEYGNTGRGWPISALFGHLKSNINQVLYDWNRKRAGFVISVACLWEGVAYRLIQGKKAVNTRVCAETLGLIPGIIRIDVAVAARNAASPLKYDSIEGTKYPAFRVMGINKAELPESYSYQMVLPNPLAKRICS
jgi:hypothetical protein